MNTHKLRWIYTILVPCLLIALYTWGISWAEQYAQRHYIITPRIIINIAGYAALGVYLMLICKYTFSNRDNMRLPLDYLFIIASTIYLIFNLFFFVPRFLYIPMSNIFNYLPICCLIAAAHLGLFIHVVRYNRRSKKAAIIVK